MNILVTGCAGFIGFNLCNSLLKNKNNKIVGIDNINNYYSIKLKKDRLKNLQKYNNFKFYKKNLKNYNSILKIFKSNKINIIYHLAAQAGVRYSIDNPKKYSDSNVIGFFNLLEISRIKNVKKIIYASSSSVYGESKFFPLNEKQRILPKNFYGLTKKINEQMAEIYSNYYKMKFIGLRFFTVYGEWGRPDMSIFKIIDASFRKKIFYLNNFGNHDRDFTYIGDVVNIIKKLRFPSKSNHKIYNIASNKPIGLKKLIKLISTLIPLPKIKSREMQKADVKKTHGDNKQIVNLTNYNNFCDIRLGLSRTINWYKSYYINNN